MSDRCCSALTFSVFTCQYNCPKIVLVHRDVLGTFFEYMLVKGKKKWESINTLVTHPQVTAKGKLMRPCKDYMIYQLKKVVLQCLFIFTNL